VSALSRSYSGFGWLLDTVEQEMIKEAIQKSRDLASDESDLQMLSDLMARLEMGAAKLTNAMFNAPDMAQAKPEGWDDLDTSEADAKRLMKSALKKEKTKA
jgi:hypothetical protein